MANNYFVGSYVTQVRDAMIASLASGQNLQIIGAPGGGKTSMSRAMASRMLDGSGRPFSLTRISPAMQLSKLTGHVDGERLLENGEYFIDLEGTPYQDGNMIAVLDELWRGSDPVFDEALIIMDREELDIADRPVTWITANFMVDNERTQATIDRIGLCLWVPAKVSAAGKLARTTLASRGRPEMPGKIPTWGAIQMARLADPSDDAMDAVVAVVDALAAEAVAAGRNINQRIVTIWANVLFRVSALYHGSGDFKEVHKKAIAALALAWPSITAADAAEWRGVVRSITNSAGMAAEAKLAQYVGDFQRVSALTDAGERNKEAVKLGLKLAEAQAELQALGADLPEVAQAASLLNTWFQHAVTGKQFEWDGGNK